MEEKDDTFPFVGRVDETGRLRRLLRKSPSWETGLNIVVTGDRGVGKTRLMLEAAGEARKLGYKSLYHRCQKWDRYRPFTTLAGLTKLLLRHHLILRCKLLLLLRLQVDLRDW